MFVLILHHRFASNERKKRTIINLEFRKSTILPASIAGRICWCVYFEQRNPLLCIIYLHCFYVVPLASNVYLSLLGRIFFCFYWLAHKLCIRWPHFEVSFLLSLAPYALLHALHNGFKVYSCLIIITKCPTIDCISKNYLRLVCSFWWFSHILRWIDELRSIESLMHHIHMV